MLYRALVAQGYELSEPDHSVFADTHKRLCKGCSVRTGKGRHHNRLKRQNYPLAKHGLEAPKDYNELYEVCKKLKELYPNAYPLCFRDGLFKLEELTTSWKPYFSQSFYYDFNNEKWLCGGQDPIKKKSAANLICLRRI